MTIEELSLELGVSQKRIVTWLKAGATLATAEEFAKTMQADGTEFKASIDRLTIEKLEAEIDKLDAVARRREHERREKTVDIVEIDDASRWVKDLLEFVGDEVERAPSDVVQGLPDNVADVLSNEFGSQLLLWLKWATLQSSCIHESKEFDN